VTQVVIVLTPVWLLCTGLVALVDMFQVASAPTVAPDFTRPILATGEMRVSIVWLTLMMIVM
jgi:hypothetical protein